MAQHAVVILCRMLDSRMYAAVFYAAVMNIVKHRQPSDRYSFARHSNLVVHAAFFHQKLR
jgi:hypothetical protein